MAVDFEGIPPMLEIREAISRGREPYIRAAEQLDVINSNASQDLNRGRDIVPLAIAFSEISHAQNMGVLQPPLTQALAGLVIDTEAAFSGVDTSNPLSGYDLQVAQSYEGLENARFLLRVVIDHGSRSAPAPASVSAVEQFDALAHERVHSDPKFEGRMKAARARRVAWKRNRSDG